MTVFAIYSRPDSGPEAIAAVPERFVWPAFLVTPLWALTKRAWGFFVLWLAAAAALFALGRFAGHEAAMGLYLLFALWSGFAAPAIRARALERSGWIAHGELTAPDIEAAESLWLTRTYGARA